MKKMEEKQKLYGPIGNGRLLDIAVYQNEKLLLYLCSENLVK